MPTQLNPYLSFRDQTREAMKFYQTVFGGKVTQNTFEEFHAAEDPQEADKIMHAMLEGEQGIVFMASDTPNNMEYQPGKNISMSLSGDDEAVLRGYWEKLSKNAKVQMPLEKAPWGDIFGMLTDQFGIQWMVNIAGEK